MIKDSSQLPDKLVKAPGRLLAVINGIIDFCRVNRVTAGPGLEANETVNGRQLQVTQSILDAARAWEDKNSGNETTDEDGNPLPSWNNPGGTGGDGGTGLPDTGTDEEGNPTDPNGDPLEWNQINVCVSDGEGGWTPMKLSIYGALSTP